MLKQVVGEKEITGAKICRLSYDGRMVRHQVEINDRILLRKIARHLQYNEVQKKEYFSCTVGETRYIVTVEAVDGKEVRVVIRNNAIFKNDQVIGMIDLALVRFLEKLALSVKPKILNPVNELLAAQHS